MHISTLPSNSKLVALVSTDVKSSTEITYANEINVLSLIDHHRNILKNLCQVHGGEILASMGDGLLLSFENVNQAMLCAIHFQQKILEEIHNPENSDCSIKHRVGIHLGLLEAQREFKSPMIFITDKVQHEAEPGGICFSRSVYDALQLKHRFSFREGSFLSIGESGVKLKLYHYAPEEIPKENNPQDFDRLEVIPYAIELAAIVFTMIDQYEERILKEAHKMYTKSSEDFQFMEKECRRFGGRWIKTMASGGLMVFSSALNAVYWATKVQRSLLLTRRSSCKHRIAINLGDIVWQGDDIAGTAVNWTARIIPYAPPGGVGISSAIYDVIFPHFPFDLYKIDDCLADLKGIPHPCRIFTLQQLNQPELLAATEDTKEVPKNYSYTEGNDLRVAYKNGVRQFKAQNFTNFNIADLDLSDSDFSRSNLSHIEATKVNLGNSILNYTNLKEANLCQSNLSNSSLKFADLSRANLQKANLRGANFYCANVSRTDFRGADLTYAYITPFQLSSAIVNQKTVCPNGSPPKASLWNWEIYDFARLIGFAIFVLSAFYGLFFFMADYPILIFVALGIVMIAIYCWLRFP